jgi:glutamine cyclotransferase
MKKKSSLWGLAPLLLMSAQIKRRLQHALFLVLLIPLSDCISAPAHAPQTLYFTVFHTMAHDSSRFTQGFAIDRGTLYESAGRYGFSGLFSQELRGGKTLHLRKNAQKTFAEGLAVLDQRVYQLSWLEHRGFIYDLALNPVGSFEYDTEGWGLTSDGERLIMSDGSAILRWLDAKTLKTAREVVVI